MLRWEEVPARLGAREKGPPAENPFRLEAGKCVPEQAGGNPRPAGAVIVPKSGRAQPFRKRSGTASCIAFVDVCASAGAFLFYSEKGDAAMFRTLKEDLDAVMERDPAARSRLEVFFLYSGFKAVRSHRKANWCYRHNLKFLARWISQRSRKKTGIEIHPGAQIGRGLFIDHGMGVVIGETTQIGDNCTLYQGVTLGGTGKDTGKRHPTLGDNVLIGAGAKVLGPFTVGDNARVAAGAVVLDAVPEGATAVGVPARVVRINGEKVPAKPPRHPCEDMDQIHVADPVSMELCRLRGEMERLEKRLQELEKAGPTEASL